VPASGRINSFASVPVNIKTDPKRDDSLCELIFSFF